MLKISIFGKNYRKKNKIDCPKIEIDIKVNNLGKKIHNSKIRTRVDNLKIRFKTDNWKKKVDAKINNSKSRLKVDDLGKK